MKIAMRKDRYIMKINVLDASTLGADIDLSGFSKLGEVEVFETTSAEQTPNHSVGADVLVLNKVKINENTLPDTANIKLICITATGFDNVDLDYCRSKNIAVCNVVGYSTDSVAQTTVASALYLFNHLPEFTRHVREGKYTDGGVANCLSPIFHEISGKTWGIVGCGNIGAKVARVAESLGCKIIVNKRTPSDEFETVDIDTLCKESDIISIHTPLNENTKGLISREKISLMKNDVIIVNVARGAVTDENAIADAIKNRQIGGFACDVYSVEPFGKEHPYNDIMHLDNVCLTPHMAWGASEARARCIDEICKNIEAFFGGERRCRVD